MPDTEQETEARQVFVPPENLPPPKALCFDGSLAATWKLRKLPPACMHESTLLSIIEEDGVKAYVTVT